MEMLRWILLLATLAQFGWLAASSSSNEASQQGGSGTIGKAIQSRPVKNPEASCDGEWKQLENGTWVCERTRQ